MELTKSDGQVINTRVDRLLAKFFRDLNPLPFVPIDKYKSGEETFITLNRLAKATKRPVELESLPGTLL